MAARPSVKKVLAEEGLVDVAGIHAEGLPTASIDARPDTLTQVLIGTDAWVEASMPIDQILPLFAQRETEVLIVVDQADAKRVEGLITEAFALQRYRLELEARQREIFGT